VIGSPSLDSLADEELLILSQEGDRKAYGELVTRYQRLVVGIAYRMSGDVMLAEDAAQDAFVRAWERLDRFTSRGEGSFRAWLCRIVTNMTLDRLRREHPAVPLDDVHLSGGPRPSERLLEEERSRSVRNAILQLPEASRAALVLREYEDLSYREIAAVLDIPLGTVMSRLNYARGKLRKSLAVLQGTSEE
jgi:RNA polymerase sigma-70 factor (ECF subfamily)